MDESERELATRGLMRASSLDAAPASAPYSLLPIETRIAFIGQAALQREIRLAFLSVHCPPFFSIYFFHLQKKRTQNQSVFKTLHQPSPYLHSEAPILPNRLHVLPKRRLRAYRLHHFITCTITNCRMGGSLWIFFPPPGKKLFDM